MITIAVRDIPPSVLADVETVLDRANLRYVIQSETPVEDAPGGFRKTDPSTSRVAAFQVTPRTGSQRHHALMAVVRAGAAGATAADVESVTRIPGIWKRLSELSKGGWIEVIGTRMVEATGAEGNVYAATPKGVLYTRQQVR